NAQSPASVDVFSGVPFIMTVTKVVMYATTLVRPSDSPRTTPAGRDRYMSHRRWAWASWAGFAFALVGRHPKPRPHAYESRLYSRADKLFEAPVSDLRRGALCAGGGHAVCRTVLLFRRLRRHAQHRFGPTRRAPRSAGWTRVCASASLCWSPCSL